MSPQLPHLTSTTSPYLNTSFTSLHPSHLTSPPSPQLIYLTSTKSPYINYLTLPQLPPSPLSPHLNYLISITSPPSPHLNKITLPQLPPSPQLTLSLSNHSFVHTFLRLLFFLIAQASTIEYRASSSTSILTYCHRATNRSAKVPMRKAV